MSELRTQDQSAKYLQWLITFLAAVFLAFQGWMATTLVDGQRDTNDRLTKIETTMAENREERQAQVNDLRSRIQRIEGDLYQRRLNGGRDD